MTERFGVLLSSYIGMTGLNQSEIANKIGIDPSYISKAANGHRNLGPNIALKFANFFEISDIVKRTEFMFEAQGFSQNIVKQAIQNAIAKTR